MRAVYLVFFPSWANNGTHADAELMNFYAVESGQHEIIQALADYKNTENKYETDKGLNTAHQKRPPSSPIALERALIQFYQRFQRIIPYGVVLIHNPFDNRMS